MTTSHTTPIPPRGERFSDPSARAVWAAINTLPTGSQHLILDELRELLGRVEKADSHQTRVRHAVGALRECAEMLGRSPSVEDYRRLRVEHPDLRLPADGTLRGWLGGTWNGCLRQAQLSDVPDGDVVVAQKGAALAKEEVIAALRECAEELEDIPTFHRYISWASKPEVKARPGRRPASQAPFERLFGTRGFSNALIESGLISESLDGLPRSSKVRFGSYFVNEETCIAALKEVARRLGHSPRVAEYKAERERIITQPEKGKLRVIPAATSVQRRFDMSVPISAQRVDVPLGYAAVQVGVKILDVLYLTGVDIAREIEVVVVRRA